MKKRVKFPLEMKGNKNIRNMEDLKANFDLKQILAYFLNGKLLVWLQDRRYDDIAEKIENLTKDDKNLPQKFAEIFDVALDVSEIELDADEIKKDAEKKRRLTQYTEDADILGQSHFVAFNQEELADLLDERAAKIYLCGDDKFSIPLTETDKDYIGVSGKETVVISSKESVDFNKLNISFQNVHFDDTYKTVSEKFPQKLLEQGKKEESAFNFGNALKYYIQASELGNTDAVEKVYNMYYIGRTMESNNEKAREWKKGHKVKITFNTSFNELAAKLVGDCFYYGTYLYPNEENATIWRKRIKLYEENNLATNSMRQLVGIYEDGFRMQQSIITAINYYKIAYRENKDAAFQLGYIYESGRSGAKNIDEAIKYYEKAAELGHKDAEEKLKFLRKTNGFSY